MAKRDLIKPSILPGFMELQTNEQLAFDEIMAKIRNGFELFGFSPMDTPIIEKAEILMAKSGGETEKQIYNFKKGDNDLALRFDLTVPLARYVAQYYKQLVFPFRRYQIGKVYRGEKPQKGRFREFYQCDIDIIDKGNLDLVNDAEIVAVMYFVFNSLGIGDFKIYLNNRKLISGFVKKLGLEEKSIEIIRAIDKANKYGNEQLQKDLRDLQIEEDKIIEIISFISISGNSDEVLELLKGVGADNDWYKQGLEELERVVNYIKSMEIPESSWEIKPSVARGLDYYTGTVYETYLTEYPDLGSVCSGGRYDDLIEYFSKEKLPGVGVSIGLTRLFDQLNKLNLVKKDRLKPTKFLIIPVEVPIEKCFSVATKTRSGGIPTEVYAKDDKLRKKMDYANKIGVKYVGILGADELQNNAISVKDMGSGEQARVSLDDLTEYLGNKLS